MKTTLQHLRNNLFLCSFGADDRMSFFKGIVGELRESGIGSFKIWCKKIWRAYRFKPTEDVMKGIRALSMLIPYLKRVQRDFALKLIGALASLYRTEFKFVVR